MSVELPKDAEGRVIPLDTEVLYDSCGRKVSVKEFISRTLVERQATNWTIKAQYDEVGIEYYSFKPKNMYLTPPDSWEKLEEDLDRCIKECDTCRYYSPDGTCITCAISGNPAGGCDALVLKDIKERICKLRGED